MWAARGFFWVLEHGMTPQRAFNRPGKAEAPPAVIVFIRRHKSRNRVVFTADSEGGDLELAAKGAALRAQFCSEGFPAYPSLERAARALAHLCRFHSRLS